MILVSACLAGEPVRYDGRDAEHRLIQHLVATKQAMMVCPELLAGFLIPRPPAEIVGGDGVDVLNGTAQVLENSGKEVTQQYIDGAYRALKIAQNYHANIVILKQHSPSCGSQKIYTGKFDGSKKKGVGVTPALFQQHGITVLSEDNFFEYLTEHSQIVF